MDSIRMQHTEEKVGPEAAAALVLVADASSNSPTSMSVYLPAEGTNWSRFFQLLRVLSINFCSNCLMAGSADPKGPNIPFWPSSPCIYAGRAYAYIRTERKHITCQRNTLIKKGTPLDPSESMYNIFHSVPQSPTNYMINFIFNEPYNNNNKLYMEAAAKDTVSEIKTNKKCSNHSPESHKTYCCFAARWSG